MYSIENRRYKSEHLIITSRFTNAMAHSVHSWPQQLVGTDSGLIYFFLCICAVTSNAYSLNGAQYSIFKMKTPSHLHEFHFISFQTERNAQSYRKMSSESNWFPRNSIYQMAVVPTRHKFEMRANQQQRRQSHFVAATKLKTIKCSSHTHVTICLDLVPHHHTTLWPTNRIKMKSIGVDVVRVCQQNMCYNTLFCVCEWVLWIIGWLRILISIPFKAINLH